MPKGTKVSLEKLNHLVNRSLKKHQPLWRKELIPPRKLRFGTKLLSKDQLLSPKRDHQRSFWKLLSQSLLSINSPWSRTHWALNPLSRPSRTATPLCSSFTRKPPKSWSRKLALSFTTSRLRRLTPSSLQEARRRPTLPSPVIKMPLILPTKSESCEQLDRHTAKDNMVTENLRMLTSHA